MVIPNWRDQNAYIGHESKIEDGRSWARSEPEKSDCPRAGLPVGPGQLYPACGPRPDNHLIITAFRTRSRSITLTPARRKMKVDEQIYPVIAGDLGPFAAYWPNTR